MTTNTISQAVNPAGADSLTWGVALASLGSGAFTLSSGVDNRPTLGTAASFDLPDMQIVFATAFTPSAGGYLSIGVVCAIDGTNYASPPGSSSIAAQSIVTQTFPLNAVSTTVLELPNLIMRPYLTKFVLCNASGGAFPSGTITATLMRRTVASF
jgi:hypothetical protein